MPCCSFRRRLSRVFDEDPKRWRMVSEFITTGGLALEIATQLHPSSFVLLAGSGTLAKATAKGMGRPAYRVVQTHFGTANNVGSVAAKEEVWEVTAEVSGKGAGEEWGGKGCLGGAWEGTLPPAYSRERDFSFRERRGSTP